MIDEQVSLEHQVELAKQEAITKSDFNTHDAWRIFDIDNLGVISPMDMRHGLQDIGVNVTQEDVNLFFERYDKDRDGRLDYREFAEALTPTDRYYQDMLSRRPSNHRRINVYRKDDVFSFPASNAFKSLLRTMISTEGASEATRQQLSRNPFFDASEAFNTVDVNKNGMVSEDEIRYMMESRGRYISNADARQVAKKMDFNRDGVVTQSEFAESVRPKSPTRRF